MYKTVFSDNKVLSDASLSSLNHCQTCKCVRSVGRDWNGPCPRRLPNASARFNMAGSSVSTGMEHTFSQPRWLILSLTAFFFQMWRTRLRENGSQWEKKCDRWCERQTKTREDPGPRTPVWGCVQTHPSPMSHLNAATLSGRESARQREINR